MSKNDKFADVRKHIDDLDDRILGLLNQRAKVSLEVGRLKAEDSSQIFKPFREKQVLGRLEVKNDGPLPDKHLQAIYREILSSSRRLQRPERVAYLGPEGTFTYFAGVGYLGQSVDMIPRPTLNGVFQAVSSGDADLGVVPLENSLQGTVGQTVDLFLRYNVAIQAETYLRISHALLGRADRLEEIKEVHSHPKALEQVERWIRRNLPWARVAPADSTAAAAATAAESDGSIAAVGHVRLAHSFGLSVLAERIEDLPDNWTRFFIIGAEPSFEGTRDKTSVLFTTADRPGALVTVLSVLAGESINLTKLESRPLQGEKWKYVFFADLECDLGRAEYDRLLDKVRENCLLLRVLGSYPAGPYLEPGAD